MKKIWLIASHEFLQNLRSRGYLVATFGAPLVFLTFLIVFGTQKGLYSKDNKLVRIGFVDETNTVVTPEFFDEETPSGSQVFSWLTQLPRKWILVDNRTNAMKELSEDRLDGVLLVSKSEDPRKPCDVSLMVRTEKMHLISLMKVDRNWLFQRWLRDGVGAVRWRAFVEFGRPTIEEIDAQGLVHQIDYEQAVLDETEKASWVHIGVFLVAIMLLSGYLSTGLTDEREQKTLEYLFTLLTPFQLLLGKLLGVLMSGILQVVTWGVTFVLPTLFFFWSMRNAFVEWLHPFLFFFFGYLFYGGVLLALSASASSGRESRQIASGWLFSNAVPLAFYPYLITHPYGWFSRVLSLFPISSPIAMMIRFGIGHVPPWEMIMSLVILFGSTLLILRLSAGRVMKNMMRKVQ